MAQEYGKMSGHKEHHTFMAAHHKKMAAEHEKASQHHTKMAGGAEEDGMEDGGEDLTDGTEFNSDNEDTVQNRMPGKLPMSFGRGAR